MTGPLLRPSQVDDLEEVPSFFLVPLSVKHQVARGGFQVTHRVLTIPRLAAVLCLSWGVSELKVASPSSEKGHLLGQLLCVDTRPHPHVVGNGTQREVSPSFPASVVALLRVT